MVNVTSKVSPCRVCEEHCQQQELLEHRCSRHVPSSVDNFVVLKTLGKGSFGTVFLAKRKRTNDLFAVKVINKRNDKKKWIYAERNNLALINSPYIVKLYSTFQTRQAVYMVMEFIRGSSLDSLIKKSVTGLPEAEVKHYFSQLTVAVKHLHEKDVSHRDLKPENMMLEDGKSLKLLDFGYSTSRLSSTEGTTSLPTEGRGENLRYTAVGTPLYASPETIFHYAKGYDSKKADIWSLGVVLFELLTGKVPFTAEDYSALKVVLRNYCSSPETYEFPFPPHVSTEARELCKRLLSPSPLCRPSLEDIQNHPFLREVCWDRLENQSNRPKSFPTPSDIKETRELSTIVLQDKLPLYNWGVYQNFDFYSFENHKQLNNSIMLTE